MLTPQEEPVFVQALVQAIKDCDGHIDCGILGSKYVLHALTDHDQIELAYRMVTRPDYPSWGNWITRGATTLWEDWEGSQSQNHHMYSDVGMLFYRGLAGIRVDPDHPGFEHFELRPAVAGALTWVNGSHDSPYGPIVSNWRIEQHTLHYHCSVPPGSTASLSLPVAGAKAVQFHNAPEEPCCQQGRTCFTLPAGRYRFECRL
jgi:alpha-L-rhamnosidase